MELRYPIILIFGILFISIVLFFLKKYKSKYKMGIKIANTQYIKNTLFYKKIIKEYRIILLLSKTLCLFSIFLSLILLARPTIIKTNNYDKYNRDIILCMDVSLSVDELNYKLVDNLKDTVKKLKGERFGISIFNTSSVTLVPLTDDYEYVISVLDQIKKSIDLSNNYKIGQDDYFYNSSYIISGTIEGSDLRGSSLIGDGLASCIYNFPNLDEERTRIIIFSTDNDLQGTPLLTLDEASELGKRKNIVVYGIGTKNTISKNQSAFKNTIEKNGGIFYSEESIDVKDIVKNIEQHSKSLMKTQISNVQIDQPEFPFILLTISIILLLILNKKVIL